MCRILDMEKSPKPGVGRYFLFDLKKSIQFHCMSFSREIHSLKRTMIHQVRQDSSFVIILLLHKLITVQFRTTVMFILHMQIDKEILYTNKNLNLAATRKNSRLIACAILQSNHSNSAFQKQCFRIICQSEGLDHSWKFCTFY